MADSVGLTLGTTSLVLWIVVYLWSALALSAVFRKSGDEGWKAWVPIYNEVVLLQRAGISAWLLLFVFVPVLGWLIVYVVHVVACHRMNIAFGLSGAMTVLAALLFPVWASVVGFGSARWLGHPEDIGGPARTPSTGVAHYADWAPPGAPAAPATAAMPTVPPAPSRGSGSAPAAPAGYTPPPGFPPPAAFPPPAGYAPPAGYPLPPAAPSPTESTPPPGGYTPARPDSAPPVSPIVPPPAWQAASAEAPMQWAPGVPPAPAPEWGPGLPAEEADSGSGAAADPGAPPSVPTAPPAPPAESRRSTYLDDLDDLDDEEVSAVAPAAEPPQSAASAARARRAGWEAPEEEVGYPSASADAYPGESPAAPSSAAGEYVPSPASADAANGPAPLVTRVPAARPEPDAEPWAPRRSPLPDTPSDTTDEVSAVAGAPMAGSPRSALGAVSALYARPELPDEDALDETIIARRRRTEWELVPPFGKPVDITSDVIILGRRPTTDPEHPSAQLIPIADQTRTVSKTHARLELRGDHWVITDLGSTNGVLLPTLMGTELEAQPGVELAAGERFFLGDAEVQLRRSEV